MDKKKRNIIIGAAAGAVVLLIGLLTVLGVFRGFNPEGYIKAVLDMSLKGEVKVASQLMKGTTEDNLYAQYESGISSFVNSSIQGIEESDEDLQKNYIDLCKKVFKSMKYSVVEAKDSKDGGYEVTVSYQPTNVFNNFVAKFVEETQNLMEKVKNGEGEYRGTTEEIYRQIQQDLLTNAYTLFEQCYNAIEYGEEETYVFVITKDADGIYDLDETQISEFLMKILNLDENQG